MYARKGARNQAKSIQAKKEGIRQGQQQLPGLKSMQEIQQGTLQESMQEKSQGTRQESIHEKQAGTRQETVQEKQQATTQESMR